MELVAGSGARTFCEVGPGAGDLSLALCRRGLNGVGVEFSSPAAAMSKAALSVPIQEGRYRLVEDDFMAIDGLGSGFDLALSMMVMEHIEDDAAFVKRVVGLVRPGGMVIIGVPARMDRWGIEDETAGHFRRYERTDLERRLSEAGLERVEVRSLAVPVANLTLHLSNFLVRRAGERKKLGLTQRARTESSGVRDIPFKTVYAAPFRLVLNPVAMYPLFLLQRAFYRTNLGLLLVGAGRKK
jgi:SAM-dependent methyltransferase